MSPFHETTEAGRDRAAASPAWLPIALSIAWGLVATTGHTAPRYQELVGEPPVPTELAFKDWLDRLVGLRLQSVPLVRATTYHFSQTGDDTSGDGSVTAPWKSLDKAQSILNQHARGTNAPGLSLRFRSGDVWRTPATLRARIQSIQGTRVLIQAPVEWTPQPNFFYELRGGGAVERMEARSFDATTGELQLLVPPASTNHQEIVLECALMVASPHITVTAYEEPGGPARGKPRFTRFVPTSGWRNSQARGDEFSRTYSLATTNRIAWIRTAEALDESFRRVTSVAQVDENPGTWFWDGANLWAREWLDTPMNGGLNAYEVVLENKSDGICVADVDDVRLDGIVVDGWGMTAQPSGSGDQRQYTGYGFFATVSGSNHVLFTHCESYYNNRHCMGNVTAAGGLLTAAWCSWGYCVEGGSAVSYAWGGRNEALFYECVNRAGSVQHGVKPYAGNLAVAGYSHHAHTSGGTNKVALFISYRCHNVPSPTMAGHCGPVDLPAADDLRACRSFVVEDTFRTRTPNGFDRTKPSSTGGTGLLRPGLVSDTTYINCWFEHALLWANGNWAPILDGNYHNTRLINCVLTYTSLADDFYLSIPNVAWEVAGLSAYNCHFDANLQTGRSLGYVGKSIVQSRNLFKNSILSFRGADYSDPLTSIRMRCINDASLLANNFYSGFTLKTGPDGYDADRWAVEGTDAALGARPEAASALASVHQQLIDDLYPLEYDLVWRNRYPVRTAIGPVEAWPALDLPPALRVQIRQMSGLPIISVYASRPCQIWLEFRNNLTETSRWDAVGPFDLNTSPMFFVDPTPITSGARAYRVRGQ
jgi:hypothetical protein